MQRYNLPLPPDTYIDMIHALVAHSDFNAVVKSIDLLKQMLVRKISVPVHLWHTLLQKFLRWYLVQPSWCHLTVNAGTGETACGRSYS